MIKECLFTSYYESRPIYTTIICVLEDLELFISTVQTRYDDDEFGNDTTEYYIHQYKDSNVVVLYRRGLFLVFSKKYRKEYINPIRLEAVRLWRMYHKDNREVDPGDVSDLELEIARKISSLYIKITNEISDKTTIDEGIPAEICI